ncbi:MAG: hypothetical protein AAFY66_11945, partial [Pseudomonadota bacterium]
SLIFAVSLLVLQMGSIVKTVAVEISEGKADSSMTINVIGLIAIIMMFGGVSVSIALDAATAN